MFELIIFKNYLFIITFLFDEFIELNKIENNKWKEERVVGDFGVEENKWKELEEGEWAWPKSCLLSPHVAQKPSCYKIPLKKRDVISGVMHNTKHAFNGKNYSLNFTAFHSMSLVISTLARLFLYFLHESLDNLIFR